MNKLIEHITPTPPSTVTEQERVLAFLDAHPIARQSELARAGISGMTLTRMHRDGLLVRVGRGVYQLPDGPIDTHQNLAHACKLVPRGVVCLTSALVYYELTDQLPAAVWMALPPRVWHPTFRYPPVQYIQFSGKNYSASIDRHRIDGVQVSIYSVTKTVVDMFRCARAVGINVAIEGLRNALRTRKTTPGKLGDQAKASSMFKQIEPYVMALTADA